MHLRRAVATCYNESYDRFMQTGVAEETNVDALARLLVPGRDPMSLPATWLLGVLGSFLGGFLGYVLFGADIDDGAVQVSGIFGSVIGAIILLLIYRAVQRRRSGRLV